MLSIISNTLHSVINDIHKAHTMYNLFALPLPLVSEECNYLNKS